MIAATCIIIASIILGIGIYSEITVQRRIARMARDFKTQGGKAHENN